MDIVSCRKLGAIVAALAASCNSALATVLINDTFNYADTAAMVSAGWAINTLVPSQGGGAFSNSYSFIGTGSGFISSNVSEQPAPLPNQTLMSLNNASSVRTLGVTMTEDFTLTAKVAMNAYARTLQLGLGNSAGAGYSIAWNGTNPTNNMGNGSFRIVAQSGWTFRTPQDTTVPGTLFLTPPWQGFSPPTRYPKPATGGSSTSDPLIYSPSDPFLGYSEIKLTWVKATGTLTMSQDNNELATVNDMTFTSFTHLFVGGGTRGYFDEIKLETTQTFARAGDFNLDTLVDGADFLQWQRGESPNGGDQTDYDAWQSNFGDPPPGVAVVPEPASLVLCGLGALAVRTFRRRALRN